MPHDKVKAPWTILYKCYSLNSFLFGKNMSIKNCCLEESVKKCKKKCVKVGKSSFQVLCRKFKYSLAEARSYLG